jgi:uncharacterized protein
MRRMPLRLLVVLVLDALFLLVALWGSRSSPPGDNAVAAGLAAIAAIVTAVPLVAAIGLWLAGLPRLATAAALVPALAVVGYQYLGVMAEREYDQTLHGADDFTDSRTRALASAIADGNDAAVRDLVAHGADLNARGPKGDTLLTFAVFYWPERVPLLLELGADPNLGSGPGTGPLYQAVVTGKTDAADALLRAGARPDVTDDEGTPVIFHSLKLEDPRMFRLLLAHGADITGHDGRAYTLLMAAAWHRHWPEAVLLLERGLDPAVVNVRGDSVQTILDEGYVDEATLADPGYQLLIVRLGERGVRVHRSASKAS